MRRGIRMIVDNVDFISYINLYLIFLDDLIFSADFNWFFYKKSNAHRAFS